MDRLAVHAAACDSLPKSPREVPAEPSSGGVRFAPGEPHSGFSGKF